MNRFNACRTFFYEEELLEADAVFFVWQAFDSLESKWLGLINARRGAGAQEWWNAVNVLPICSLFK